jgi:hypothetical protein
VAGDFRVGYFLQILNWWSNNNAEVLTNDSARKILRLAEILLDLLEMTGRQ